MEARLASPSGPVCELVHTWGTLTFPGQMFPRNFVPPFCRQNGGYADRDDCNFASQECVCCCAGPTDAGKRCDVRSGGWPWCFCSAAPLREQTLRGQKRAWLPSIPVSAKAAK